VDVFLRVSSNDEGRNIDNLLSNSDVSLSDQNTSVVDGLGEVQLENFGLQSALHEDLGGQLEDIIEGVLVLSHDAVALETADEGRGLEQSLWVLGVKGQQDTSSLSDFREHELHSPDLTLASQSIFTAELELLIQTLLLEGTSHSSVRLP